MDGSKALAAEKWFGYGRWSARYWFVGKEPGGTDDPENYESWARLGALDLIDCREHDLEYRGEDRGIWHIGKDGAPPKLQPTWRALIALLMSYKSGSDYDPSAIRDYQAERWGRSDGETCVIELSAIAAPSTATYEAMRLYHLPERVAHLRQKIADNIPEFVVFYGGGVDPVYGEKYLEYWRRIASLPLEIGEPRLSGKTVFCVTKHPAALGVRNAYWTDMGRRIAGARRKERTLSN